MGAAREYATLFAAMSRVSVLIPFLALMAAGCSSLSKKQPVIVPAGEKATVGPLVYSVIDTEVLTQLGDDPNTARRPQTRFFLMTVSVSNSSTEDLPIPALTLVDDSGKEYNEVVDGTNVPNWLGVIRRVGGAQTEQGNLLFDAPAGHYRLRLTDEADESELSIDVPLNFVHEQFKTLPSDALPPPGK
ncbi:MAG: DUF4352 domain-containing protein [Bryobacteraceae bacterium]|jgi:hypothetical protein